MNSGIEKQEIILKTPFRAKPPYLRLVLPLLVTILLVACSAPRIIKYKGTCTAQTQQFIDYIYHFVIDDLNPVIADGINSGPSPELTKRLEELDARILELNTPECNARAETVKEALRQYMLETRNYFSVVAGRAVYGEGAVQGQWSTMYEAGYTFELSLEDLQQ